MFGDAVLESDGAYQKETEEDELQEESADDDVGAERVVC